MPGLAGLWPEWPSPLAAKCKGLRLDSGLDHCGCDADGKGHRGGEAARQGLPALDGEEWEKLGVQVAHAGPTVGKFASLVSVNGLTGSALLGPDPAGPWQACCPPSPTCCSLQVQGLTLSRSRLFTTSVAPPAAIICRGMPVTVFKVIAAPSRSPSCPRHGRRRAPWTRTAMAQAWALRAFGTSTTCRHCQNDSETTHEVP